MGKTTQTLSPEAREYADRQAREAARAAEEEQQTDAETDADETGEDDIDPDEVDAGWASTAPMDLDTLAGDLRDVMLTRIRTMQKPWQQMTESEQRMVAEGVAMGARKLVRDAVRLLNTYDFPHCVVALGEVKIKGEKGIEAKIGAANVEANRNVLGDHVGDMVMMLMVDSETFMGARKEVQIDPDQPDLPSVDERDEAA